MRYQGMDELKKSLQGIVEIDGKVRVVSKEKLRGQAIDRLVFNGVFHENAEIKQAARNMRMMRLLGTSSWRTTT